MDQKKKLRLVLLLSWATYMVAYLCRVNISTALDKLSAGLTVSTEYLGVASSIYFVTYAVGQLVNGSIGDRVDPHRFLMLACGNRTSLLTVLLIAALIAVINASNWYMISYLPMYFAKRNIVSTLVGAFDFSTYVGASMMSGALGSLLVRFGWIALPSCWMAPTVLELVLSLVGARVFPTVLPEKY